MKKVFLEKADSFLPEIKSTTIKPLPEKAVLNKGDSIVLDLGNHLCFIFPQTVSFLGNHLCRIGRHDFSDIVYDDESNHHDDDERACEACGYG